VNLTQVAAARRVWLGPRIRYTEDWCKKNYILPSTEISIYMDYPEGWHAIFGVGKKKVYILYSKWGELELHIEPFQGYYLNGGLITGKKSPKIYHLKGETYGRTQDTRKG